MILSRLSLFVPFQVHHEASKGMATNRNMRRPYFFAKLTISADSSSIDHKCLDNEVHPSHCCIFLMGHTVALTVAMPLKYFDVSLWNWCILQFTSVALTQLRLTQGQTRIPLLVMMIMHGALQHAAPGQLPLTLGKPADIDYSA